MKRISLWSVDRDDTLHIDDEIKKLEEAHSVMISANRALVEGDDLGLTRLGFDSDHIDDLKAAVSYTHLTLPTIYSV